MEPRPSARQALARHDAGDSCIDGLSVEEERDGVADPRAEPDGKLVVEHHLAWRPVPVPRDPDPDPPKVGGRAKSRSHTSVMGSALGTPSR